MRRIGTMLLAVALGGPGCGRHGSRSDPAAGAGSVGVSSNFPMQVTDDLGRAVNVPRPPRRILTLLPSFTETVFALGAGARVVGVDDYSDYPEIVKTLPKLGGMFDTQTERVAALEADLIFAPASPTTVNTLAPGGTAVWAGEPRHFDDVYRTIELIARLIDRPKEGAQLISSMREEVANIEASVRGLSQPRVYYELDSTPYTVGPNSFIGVLLTKAGGVNIVPNELGDFPKINPELVVSADPEVILGVSLSEVEGRAGWTRISAIRTKRVFAWSGAEAHLVSRPGPRLPEGLRALARRLHETP